MTTFDVQTHYNEYLAAGAGEVNAVVVVTASGTGAVRTEGSAPDAAEIILLDVSGSMTGKKLREAKKATMAALDTLRDGVQFAVVGGHSEAMRLYPERGPLATAADVTRSEAKAAVAEVDAGGGTAIGTWLLEAARLFPTDAGMIRHAILLTDGENQDESLAQLIAAVEQCEGRFQCDCRGVGDEWRVTELREIASRLLGDVAVIPQPDEMEAEFRSMMERSMGKAVDSLRLRVWAPVDATVQLVKQVYPDIIDLTATREEITPQIGDYATGAWGDQTREFHIQVRFPARNVDDEMRAARVTAMVGDEELFTTSIDVAWTDDPQLSTKQVPRLDATLGQVESARLADEGFRALEDGDVETATARLVSALEGYQKAGNQAQADAIGRLLEADGDTMKLKESRSKMDEIQVQTATTRTERLGPDS
jgi:hypothetical protein